MSCSATGLTSQYGLPSLSLPSGFGPPTFLDFLDFGGLVKLSDSAPSPESYSSMVRLLLGMSAVAEEDGCRIRGVGVGELAKALDFTHATRLLVGWR